MAERSGFRRNVGLFMAVMIGIGAMMGPGIFALPSEVAASVGPLGIVAYLAMGLLTVFTALNYAELGAALPIAGGGYSFTSRVLPHPVAFVTGWFFWIGNTLACALYAVIFALTIEAYFWPDVSLVAVILAVTIAASNDDDRNAIAALQARRLGIDRVIAIVRDPNYVELLEDAGVECISQPYATAAMVENYLDRPGIAELFEIETGVASLMEITVPEDGEVVGRSISEIDIPEDCVVAAVIREREFVVPRGDTEIRPGDQVVLVGPSRAVREAHRTFSGGTART